MHLAIAKAIAETAVPQCTVVQWQPYVELRRLYKLARWLTRFAPVVGLDSSLLQAVQHKTVERVDARHTGLLLDITGTARWHRGEYALAVKIAKAFARWGLTARLGIASTIGAAWAFSRYGERNHFVSSIEVLAQGHLADALAMLPIAALRLSGSTENKLKELGIATIDDLLRIPRNTLSVRFGGEVLLRLEQALGLRIEHIEAVTAPHIIEEQQEYETPIENQETLQAAVYNCFAKLFKKLQRGKRGAQSFRIAFQYRNQEQELLRIEKELSLLRSSADFTVFSAVVRPVIERLNVAGPVHSVAIRAQGVARVNDQQRDYLQHLCMECEEAASNLLNHYTVRMGRGRVRTAVLHPAYLPEESFSFIPIEHGARPITPPPLFHPSERPTHLFTPEPIEVMALLPDKPPSMLLWRGRRCKVLTGLGPERICGPWWQRGMARVPTQRDYFKVQEESGRWLWIFRENSRWFVQGIFS